MSEQIEIELKKKPTHVSTHNKREIEGRENIHESVFSHDKSKMEEGNHDNKSQIVNTKNKEKIKEEEGENANEGEPEKLEDKTERILNENEKSAILNKDVSGLDLLEKKTNKELFDQKVELEESVEDKKTKEELNKINQKKLKAMCGQINMSFIITVCFIKEGISMNIIAYLTITNFYNILYWYIGIMYFLEYLMSILMINYYIQYFLLIWINDEENPKDADDIVNPDSNVFYISFPKEEVKEKFKLLFKRYNISMWLIYIAKMICLFTTCNIKHDFDKFMIFNILQIAFDRYFSTTISISFNFFVTLDEYNDKIGLK